MENQETIKKYELCLILDAKISKDDKDAIVQEAVEIANKSGAKIINSQVWLDNQKLKYEIKKCNEGTYYLVNFEGQSEVIGKMNSTLRLNERILRYAIMNAE